MTKQHGESKLWISDNKFYFHSYQTAIQRQVDSINYVSVGVLVSNSQTPCGGIFKSRSFVHNWLPSNTSNVSLLTKTVMFHHCLRNYFRIANPPCCLVNIRHAYVFLLKCSFFLLSEHEDFLCPSSLSRKNKCALSSPVCAGF